MKTVNEIIPQQLPLLFQIPPPRSDFWREEVFPNAAPYLTVPKNKRINQKGMIDSLSHF